MRAATVLALCVFVLAGACSTPARVAESAEAAAPPPSCVARIAAELPPISPLEQQSLVIETFGACSDAMVALWVDRTGRRGAPGSVQALHLARLSDYGARVRDAASADAAIHSIYDRLEMDGSRLVETWAALQRAGDQPDGASWRGTPLSRSEYQRIMSGSSRLMLIPTDGGRAKLVAWDESAESWIDVIYYGD